MTSSLMSRGLDDSRAIEELDSAGPAASPPAVQLRRVLVVIGALAVAAVHFRPWEGAMLEDWELADAWRTGGLAGLPGRLHATLGRPLHLLPHYLGMALSNGGVTGPYAVLVAVAVAQFVVAMWAVRPLVSAWWTRWALALLVALHPWWVAGDILRFMPAQVAVLGVVVWLGASLRYLQSGRGVWLIPGGFAVVLGLLTYQGPALALVMGSVALAVSASMPRRGVRLVLVTTAAVGAVLMWSIVIVPKLVPDSYEAQLMSGGLTDPVASVRAILRTLLLHGEGVLVLLGAVAITVIALGLHARLWPWQVWILLGFVAASPLAALAYASNTLHLNDPERVVLPVGVLLWIVACSVADRLPVHGGVARGVLAVVLIATALGGAAGYARWTGYSSAQQELLAAVEAVREEVPADATVIVEDTTGRYGDVYLLLPPHLNYALDVEYGAGADGVLCTASGAPRDQPDAALYPIATTPDCSEYLAASTATYLGEAMTDFGLVRFHLMR
jgi:hypothetical protein